jgi:hypothetical protein
MAERFEIQDEVKILQNDPDLNAAFEAAGFVLIPQYTSGDTSPVFTGDTFIGNYYLTAYGYNALANFYFTNLLGQSFGTTSDTFFIVSVADLAANSSLTGPIWSIISNPRSTPYGTPTNFAFTNSTLAEWLFYTFKYSSIKTFFRQNAQYFLPDYDYSQINSSDELSLFLQSFMREFDRFTRIIDEVYDIVDINRIPTNYLQYLGQLLGYERTDYQLLTNSTFRELLKNILEIYAIKGTNYSFQLFFNLLGYSVTPQEMWFDKRFADTGITSNPYTLSTNKNQHQYYLTPNDPTTTIPSGMLHSYSVTQDQITASMDLQMFDTLTSWYLTGDSRGYPPLLLTGNFAPALPYLIQGNWPIYEGNGTTSIDWSINHNNLILNKLAWTVGGAASAALGLPAGINNGFQLSFPSKADTKIAYTVNPITISTHAITISFWAAKGAGDSMIVFNFGMDGVDGFKMVANVNGGGYVNFNEGTVINTTWNTGIGRLIQSSWLRDEGPKDMLSLYLDDRTIGSPINPVLSSWLFGPSPTSTIAAGQVNIAGSIESFPIPNGTFDNSFRNYTFTYDSATKEARFFKNGVLVFDIFTTNSAPFPTNRVFALGNYYPLPTPTRGWIGTFDQIVLYSRALHPYEVKQLYSPLPAGDTYTFFKSNIIQYSIATLAGTPASLTSSQLNSFNFYVNFLTPIFLQPLQAFQAVPTMDSADTNGWFLLDADRTDPVYINRAQTSDAINRYFPIKSITVNAGDTYHPRGQIVVGDSQQNLIKFIHPEFTPPQIGVQTSFQNPVYNGPPITTSFFPIVQVSSDSNVLKRVFDNISLSGTSATSNDGTYTLASDTRPPYYNATTQQTTLFVKGDTRTGMHGTSKGAGGLLYIGGPQTMGHTYSGYYPAYWYWEQYNKEEANRAIPQNSTLFKLYSVTPTTADNIPPVRMSPPIFEPANFGATANPRIRFPGYGVTGFWRQTVNNLRTTKMGDTSKWGVNPNLVTQYQQMYDPSMGDSIFKWQPGSDFTRTIVGDTAAFPDKNGIGKYYIPIWIYGDTSLGTIKITAFFTKIGDSLFSDTWLVSGGLWNFVNPSITTNTAHHNYNGVGWLIRSSARSLLPGDTFKAYRPQVQFGDSLYSRAFVKAGIKAGDSLSYLITYGDSGAFECWVRPYFNYNTVMDKYILSDFSKGDLTIQQSIGTGRAIQSSWLRDEGPKDMLSLYLDARTIASPITPILSNWLFGSAPTTTGDTTRIALKYNASTQKFTFFVGDTGGNYRRVSSSSAYTSNTALQQWLYLKATWSVKQKSVEFYINGVVQQGDSSYSANPVTWTKGQYLSIGSTPFKAVDYAFDGLITDALLSNYFTRTKNHYADSLPYTQTNPLGVSGHHISGYHIDTFSAYYDPTNPNSAYSIVSAANPSWSTEQVYAFLNTSLSSAGDSGLSSYGIRPRDIYPIIDSTRNMKPGHYSGTVMAGDSKLATSDSWVIYKRLSTTSGTQGNTVWARGVGASIQSNWLRDEGPKNMLGLYLDARTVDTPINAVLSNWLFGTYLPNITADSRVFWRHGGFQVSASNIYDSGDTGSSITLGGNWPLRVWDARPNERYYQNYNTANYTRADTLHHITDGSILAITNNYWARGVGAAIQSSWSRDEGPKNMLSLYLDNRTIGAPINAVLSNWLFGANTNVSSIAILDQNSIVPGDSWRRFKHLTRADYITLEAVQDERNKTTVRVLGISNAGSTYQGDTSIITVTPVLQGSNQSIAQGYIYFEPIRKIQTSTVNNGSGFGKINVFDGSRLMTGLKYGDTIEVRSTGDSQVSTLYTVDSVGHYRIAGDSGISIILTTKTLRRGGDSKGFVRTWGRNWGLGYPLYTFMNESFQSVKVR